MPRQTRRKARARFRVRVLHTSGRARTAQPHHWRLWPEYLIIEIQPCRRGGIQKSQTGQGVRARSPRSRRSARWCVLGLRERGPTHVADRDPRGHELLPDAVSVNVGLDCERTLSHEFYAVESMA
jgi:hypothetical protein